MGTVRTGGIRRRATRSRRTASGASPRDRCALYALLVVCLTGAATSSAAPATAAVLRLLIWEGYAPTSYVKPFEQYIRTKYGREARLEVTTIEAPEDFYGPIRLGTVDLVTLTHHHFKDERFRYISAGLLLPLRPEHLPNLTHVLPALRSADYLQHAGELYGIPLAQGPYGLAYCRARVPQTPLSWKILWTPPYRGRYVIAANEYVYNVVTTALAWDYPRDALTRYETLNRPAFRAKLRRLATGAHGFWIGQDEPNDLAGMSLAMVWGDSLAALRRRGEVWDVAQPREGTLYWVDNYAMTRALADKPFLRRVAEEWINRLLEPDYQVDYLLRQLSIGPVTTDIAPRLTPAEKAKLHVGTPDDLTETRVLLPTCSRRDRNGLKLLWREAMRGLPATREVAP